ncbi:MULTISPECIES: hypothetical protein [Enterococcus]|uniref:DUF3592 domain-containing protein n=1 Tax=Enterococcus sulfureus ATCC 49903 TaxID=1140003 RepID=S0NX90_9ENTE|nr:hypothetical protein [Enterococcus sulfureus]EOT46480.1 hypothetical protein OMY_01629 [Enterococcus sulfureus ATCC 49903]EOT86207.1 hypothetical protein I573_00960 [Enterococcus sulfureus ATCC 49903]
MKKFLIALSILFLGSVTVLMPVISYTSWKQQQEFSNGDKLKTKALIKVEDGVKTYNYKENDYGVDASKSSFEAGDIVTVYLLKNKPYIVAENPYVYQSKVEIFMPLFWFVLLGLATINLIRMNYLLYKRV